MITELVPLQRMARVHGYAVSVTVFNTLEGSMMNVHITDGNGKRLFFHFFSEEWDYDMERNFRYLVEGFIKCSLIQV